MLFDVICASFVMDNYVRGPKIFGRIHVHFCESRSNTMAKAEMGGYGGRVLGKQVGAMKGMKVRHPRKN